MIHFFKQIIHLYKLYITGNLIYLNLINQHVNVNTSPSHCTYPYYLCPRAIFRIDIVSPGRVARRFSISSGCSAAVASRLQEKLIRGPLMAQQKRTQQGRDNKSVCIL